MDCYTQDIETQMNRKINYAKVERKSNMDTEEVAPAAHIETQRSFGQRSAEIFFHNVNILKMYVTTCFTPTNVEVTFQMCVLSFCCFFLQHFKADIDSHSNTHGVIRISG